MRKTRANRRIYRTLIDPLESHHRRFLDNLLNVAPDMNITWLVWLRQSPLKPNPRCMREPIERLKVFQSLALPDGLGRQIDQNRLLKMAREERRGRRATWPSSRMSGAMRHWRR